MKPPPPSGPALRSEHRRLVRRHHGTPEHRRCRPPARSATTHTISGEHLETLGEGFDLGREIHI
jgi:hypothetical protein